MLPAPLPAAVNSSQRTNHSNVDSRLAFSGFLADAKDDFPP
jgi:hypothetical protein